MSFTILQAQKKTLLFSILRGEQAPMAQRFGIFFSTLMIALSSPLIGAAAQTSSTSTSFTAVVELFTSQGCSSCPPADRLLKTYADRKDVLALTMPVDYWDYLGWKDTFASPLYSKRQRDYAHTRGDGAVYTPQVVVNGLAHMNGANKRAIDGTIQNFKATENSLFVPVEIQRDGRKLNISTGDVPKSIGADEGTIWLALVQKEGEVPVRRGENGGRKLVYHNIVRQLMPVGMWTAKGKTLQVAESALSGDGTHACVVLLQRGTSGAIVGAAWIDARSPATN